MKTQHDLFEKYYKGETTLEEEEQLRNQVLSDENATPEKLIFGYYQNEAEIPANLGETIAEGWKNHRLKTRKLWWYSLTSAAASIAIFITIYLNVQAEKNHRINSEFLVMEQALYQVSKSIKPAEQQEMLVLWVDDNVEIIVN